ncbi:hypothetical protein DACRYDRAFT_115584 [Dacryopinax primogenitus]|uniref:Zn(2)-C6 fungal-type domain-containing protein n=1 Tax=Dacryopinax primogenitus (strain DJM 731) TaxID=1858805 RepID=M5G9I1_DACPD|nr:uncharacterized protein DACRYDRAFT_115584 [Dacryopinax primogenitus]EJU02522.1 hypothetical protein DACRYDRAFT_115584 [Dacryopinax primogenitus]
MAPKRKAAVVAAAAPVDPSLREGDAEETSPPGAPEAVEAHPPPAPLPYPLPHVTDDEKIAPTTEQAIPTNLLQPPAGYYGIPYPPWGFAPIPYPPGAPGAPFPPPGYQLPPYYANGQLPPMPGLIYGPAPVPVPPPKADSAPSGEGDEGYSEADENPKPEDDEDYKPGKKHQRKSKAALPHDPDHAPKKANIACHYCRKRKIKCDETRPSCLSCVRLGQDCFYDDLRRFRGKAKSTLAKEKKSARMSARHKANSFAKEMPQMKFSALPMPGDPSLTEALSLAAMGPMPPGNMPKFMFWNAPPAANVDASST